MEKEVKEIKELLDQMIYDSTNETAPEIYEELESKYKELTGQEFIPEDSK